MSFDLDQFGQPLRRFPAHYAAAVLALGGALAVQSAWYEIATRPLFESWWPLDAALVAITTLYLLAVAELHFRSACWRPNELVPRLWVLGRALGAQAMIGLFVVLVYWHGAEASTLRAGLWIIPPTLLAVAAASCWTILSAFRDGWKRFTDDIPPKNAPSGKARNDLVHSLLAVALLLGLWTIENTELQVPPRKAPPAAAVTSPASGHTNPRQRRL